MATHNEVLSYLRPDGGYISYGANYEGITFEPQCEPFTKEEYETAFEELYAIKAQAEAERQAKRQSLLDKLGITEEEAKLLLS